MNSEECTFAASIWGSNGNMFVNLVSADFYQCWLLAALTFVSVDFCHSWLCQRWLFISVDFHQVDFGQCWLSPALTFISIDFHQHWLSPALTLVSIDFHQSWLWSVLTLVSVGFQGATGLGPICRLPHGSSDSTFGLRLKKTGTITNSLQRVKLVNK